MHQHQVSGKRFGGVTLLNAIITVVEILGGIFSGSLSLLSDAMHNLSDTVSIAIGYGAQIISQRPENSKRTYGYQRAQILAALFNAALLVLIAVVLIIEAIQRFQHPEKIDGPLMLVVAVIGLIANFVSMFLLNAGKDTSLNIKATYLHLLSDTLSSVAVIIGALVLTFTDAEWVDPLLTIIIALYIAYEAWPIIKTTFNILMQTSPAVNYDEIERDLLAIDGICHVHHLHAWMIDEHHNSMSLHINCNDIRLSEAEQLYQQVDQLLKDKYQIDHVTIQAECYRGRHERLFNPDSDQF